MDNKTRPTVFISSTRGSEGSGWVSRFRNALRERGVDAWDPLLELHVGELWRESLRKALHESRAVVFVVDDQSARSPLMNFEIGAAVAEGKRMFCVAPKPIEPAKLPELFRSVFVIQGASADEAGSQIAQLVAELPDDRIVVVDR